MHGVLARQIIRPPSTWPSSPFRFPTLPLSLENPRHRLGVVGDWRPQNPPVSPNATNLSCFCVLFLCGAIPMHGRYHMHPKSTKFHVL